MSEAKELKPILPWHAPGDFSHFRSLDSESVGPKIWAVRHSGIEHYLESYWRWWGNPALGCIAWLWDAEIGGHWSESDLLADFEVWNKQKG